MVEACVVDTDVVSYIFRADDRADPFELVLDGGTALISFMTLAELERWTLQRRWGVARRAQLDAFLNRFTLVLASRALCRTWAEVSDQARRNGRPIQTADAWIAATAISLDLPLLTNNRRDFSGVDGLVLLPESAR